TQSQNQTSHKLKQHRENRQAKRQVLGTFWEIEWGQEVFPLAFFSLALLPELADPFLVLDNGNHLLSAIQPCVYPSLYLDFIFSARRN
ncbi:hypothetical protein, partial [Enterococcus faecalis]|uniref:hypothetical protein n=1 Tax=Enterococcus faecalis TaxID=1351 RepID=UPI003CC581A7